MTTHHLVVQSPALSAEHAEQLAALAQAQGIARISATAARLLDVQHDESTRAEVVAWAEGRGIDTAFLPAGLKLSDCKVLAMDMDSTLINIECIDEIAGVVGVKDKVSEITEAAMRGEIKDFAESLRRRVALLALREEAGDRLDRAVGDGPAGQAADADAELETARTHLAYGQWLRRQRRITEARTHLSSALAAFDAAGAAPFADRAAAELRAAGVATPAGTPRQDPASSLTSQELQIAQLAAAGLTNREIADRIYVSHRTVAAHLYKMFPKLGITNRNQLHTVLGQQQ